MTRSKVREACLHAAALLAVVSLPLDQKLPLPVAQVALQDIAIALAFLLFVPRAMKEARNPRTLHSLMYPLLFVGAVLLSAATAAPSLSTIVDLAQLVLYCLIAAWIFNRLQTVPQWRMIQRYGLAAAFLLSAGIAVLADTSGVFPAAIYCLPGIALLFASSLDSFRKTRIAFAAVSVAAAVILAIPFLTQPQAEGVPERYREAYASLSATSEHPLFGVGLGNYQSHIGAFYQGMPKENTIHPGTRIGHAVVLASTGLLGLAAYLCWFASLWLKAANPCLKGAVLVVFVAGFVTPMLTTPALLLTALVHGTIMGGGPGSD